MQEKSSSTGARYVPGMEMSRKTGIFLICLALSAFIWLLTVLSDTVIISKPLRIRVLPPEGGYSVGNGHFLETEAQVKTKGFKVLTEQLSGTPEVELRPDPTLFGKAALKRGYITLRLSQYAGQINSGLGDDFEVVGFQPDSVRIDLRSMKIRRVPVVFSGSVSYIRQHDSFGDIRFTPDSVEISGSDEDLANVHAIYTENINLKNLETEDIRMVNLDYSPYNGRISGYTDEVEMTIPVAEFTEKKLSVPIEIRNLPDTLSVFLYPSRAEVRVNVALDEYKRIDEASVTVFTNYSEMFGGRSQTVPLHAERNRSRMRIVHVSPPQTEYLLVKKKK